MVNIETVPVKIKSLKINYISFIILIIIFPMYLTMYSVPLDFCLTQKVFFWIYFFTLWYKVKVRVNEWYLMKLIMVCIKNIQFFGVTSLFVSIYLVDSLTRNCIGLIFCKTNFNWCYPPVKYEDYHDSVDCCLFLYM